MMILLIKRVLFTFLCSSLFCSFVYSGTQTVRYSLAGNHKGVLYYPDYRPKKMGVVIYNYDEYYLHHGAQRSKERGYDLEEIARLFNLKGYLMFVPERRSETTLAIQGAIIVMQKHPLVDSSRIHMMGVSMGASLSILSAAQQGGVASIIVVTPSPMYEKGLASLAELVRKIDKIQCPVMIGVGTQDKSWRTEFGYELKKLLIERGKKVYFEEYDAPKAWFWLPRSIFMRHVYQLLEQVDGIKAPVLPGDELYEDEDTPIQNNVDMG